MTDKVFVGKAVGHPRPQPIQRERSAADLLGQALTFIERGVQTTPVRPEPPWPPARLVRRVLTAARRRYHSVSLTERPSIDNARSYVGLFPLSDLIVLAKSSYWPLPTPALAWLAKPPTDRARRRKRWKRRTSAVVREVMAVELPGAVSYLTRGNCR